MDGHHGHDNNQVSQTTEQKVKKKGEKQLLECSEDIIPPLFYLCNPSICSAPGIHPVHDKFKIRCGNKKSAIPWASPGQFPECSKSTHPGGGRRGIVLRTLHDGLTLSVLSQRKLGLRTRSKYR
jgi:hypothetical protein